MLGLIHDHAHGYVMVPVALACRKAGLFRLLEAERRVSFARLTRELHANPGHLRVALVLFESLGWMTRNSDEYTLTGPAASCHDIPEGLDAVVSLSMASYLRGEDDGATLEPWIELSRRSWDIPHEQLARMLDGVIITPLMAALARLGDLQEVAGTDDVWKALSRGGIRPPDCVKTELASFFYAQGWIPEHAANAPLTPKGSFIFSRPFLFAIVGSYQPMLARMRDVLFGDCAAVFARDDRGHERHIDRTLNVVGSGQQHGKYFTDLERLLVDIFDTEAVETQPACIADVGCGDGSLLRHVHDVVVQRTRRGRHLQRFPLTLIGIDYNEQALLAAATTLQGLDHLLLAGDIADPEQLIADLERHGIHDTQNVLHIRSFMDHDRTYIAPIQPRGESADRIACDSAFVDRQGREIHPADAYQSLVQHLQRWAGILGRHPLIVLEVHSLPPSVVHTHLSECENLHFDACQRFSHQMLVDANQFLLAAAEAGLFAGSDGVRRYPRTLGFTRITLTAFERRGYRIRHASPGDLPALERLEQDCWESGLRTPAPVLRARLETFPQGHFVAEMNDRVVAVIYTQRLEDAGSIVQATSDTVDRFHSVRGTVIQLVSLSVAPDAQPFGVGDQLLELVLQCYELSSDVSEIVGVTRCKEYYRHAHLSHEAYIALRDAGGMLVDPVLRFHQRHGAEIQRSVAGYRANDTSNHGYGVLIRYDVNERRRLTAQPADTGQADRAAAAVGSAEIDAFLRRTTARILDRDDALVSFDRPLMDMGLDSVGLVELGVHIASRFALKLESTFFFEHNTLGRIAGFIGSRAAPRPLAAPASRSAPSPASPEQALGVAIIGVACRLPAGIDTPEQLWRALVERQSLVGNTADISWRWSAATRPAADVTLPAHVAHIDGIESFDASFFSISPAEAELMDPQQRIVMEMSWQCIEDAGYDVGTLSGSATGVFVGVSGSDYKTLHDKRGGDVEPHYALATSTSVIPNRISYFFDFSGPSVQTDTACSSSLVAVHQAVQSLLAGECDAALAGGISLICEPSHSVAYNRAGMLAPDGTCKTFDARSNGYVRGEGAVIFLLKTLAKAQADKDHIYATIIGSAVNHGGRAAGLTAPNPRKQAELLTKAWRAARITPDRLGYIEAHGTGTALGDPVEIEGVTTAFSTCAPVAPGPAETRCAIGSVKTNIGHLEAAAGAAGLLKAVLCLQHREIPATLNFRQLNPGISFKGTPLCVSTNHDAWPPPRQGSRIAGVSSFGSGGTNAHVVVQEFTAEVSAPDARESPRGMSLVLLSARTDTALRRREADLLAWLSRAAPVPDIGEISATLALGRAHFEYRSAYVVSTVAELIETLAAAARLPGQRGAQRGRASSELRQNPLIEKVTQAVLEELRNDSARNPESWHDALRALAELYLLGFDVDWHRLFYERMSQRRSLPTYPFDRERFWLGASAQPPQAAAVSGRDGQAVSASPARRQGVAEPEWCCVTERWVPASVGEDVDWRQELARREGATIYIVHADEDEKDRLTSLLARVLSTDAATPHPARRIYAVHQRDLQQSNVSTQFDPLPDVVFCLGPTLNDTRGGEIDGNPAATVFHLSQALMRLAWDRPIRLYYIYDESPSRPRVDCDALTGLVRSAMLENARHAWKVLAFVQPQAHVTRHQALLQEWLSDDPIDLSAPERSVSARTPVCDVRYGDSGRSIRTLLETTLPSPRSEEQTSHWSGFRRGGTYLITGGLGPIGEQLCQQLARRLQPTLVIFSRGTLAASRQHMVERLRSLGATVHYFSVDITDRDRLARTFQLAKERAGEIHGVIHLARLVDDGLIASKSWESFQRVIQAKTLGTVLLDTITANEPLDVFMLFSSIAANGIRGSSDYAYSAAFQHAFARYRTQLERPGPTVALGWGPWTLDTYQSPGRDERFRSAGFDLIDMSDAWTALDRGWRLQAPVMYLMKVADLQKVRRHMGLPTDGPPSVADSGRWQDLENQLRRFEARRANGQEVAKDDVVELLSRYDLESMPQSLVDSADRLLFADDTTRPSGSAVEPTYVRRVLRDSVGEVLKLPSGYDDERTLQSLGLDSVSAMQLATRVETRLGLSVQPRWFIEFSTIPVLAEHLAAQMAARTPQRDEQPSIDT